MKKPCLLFLLVSLVGFLAFGDYGEQEEIDFLLFLPNSGNQFVNEDEARLQLDNMADYLMGRDLSPGQISVHGYAAAAANDIDPVNLSRSRAHHVINELHQRGLPGDLFAEPVAYGPVDLWGANRNEGDRSPNRRVRIFVDDTVLIPSAFETADNWVETCDLENHEEENFQEPIPHEFTTEEAGSQFPWWILPLVLLGVAVNAAVIFLTSRRRESLSAEDLQETSLAVPAASLEVSSERIYVLEEDEIRHHAYELYKKRNGQNEDAVEDWHGSVNTLTNYYEAQGYLVILHWQIYS